MVISRFQRASGFGAGFLNFHDVELSGYQEIDKSTSGECI